MADKDDDKPMGVMEAIDALEQVASNPNSSDDDAERAEDALRSIMNNKSNKQQARYAAEAALGRLERRSALAARMGLSVRAKRPHAEGRSHVFPVMTREQSRQFAARKR